MKYNIYIYIFLESLSSSINYKLLIHIETDHSTNVTYCI